MQLSRTTLLAAFTLISMVHIQDSSQQGFKFDTKNKENVVASRLEGTWRLVNSRVNGYTAKSKQTRDLTFTFDASAIPQRVFKKLGRKIPIKMTVYAVGRVKGVLSGSEHPFFLSTIHGSPRIFWFRERNGDAFGDLESMNVMLARGSKKENDLLFRGGDFNNQPFAAYERVATSPLVHGAYKAALDELGRAYLRMRTLWIQNLCWQRSRKGWLLLGRHAGRYASRKARSVEGPLRGEADTAARRDARRGYSFPAECRFRGPGHPRFRRSHCLLCLREPHR